MASPLTSSNRLNIPAICRIRRDGTGATVGTGVLVAPGIILTSRHAIGDTKEAASTLFATFFEGTKKRVADVRLLPEKYFFTSAFPEHIDYSLVACEEGPLLNVTPVRVPLTQREWATVNDGDVVLVVQHPITESDGDRDDGSDVGGKVVSRDGEDGAANEAAGDGDGAVERKLFEEVLRCRDGIYYLKTKGLARTTGCPAFNDLGDLIGLQSQRPAAEGEGVINRILSISSIVKHMFALKQLAVLPQQLVAGPTGFEDVWDTWFVEKDITRVYAILENFKGKEMVRSVTARLCEMMAKPNCTINADEEAGAVSIVLANMKLFPQDGDLLEMGLHALWNTSVGSNAVLDAISRENGVEAVVTIMETFPHREETIQFGVVILGNIAEAGIDIFSSNRTAERLLVLIMEAIKRYTDAIALQKFSLSMLTRLLRWQQSQPNPSAFAVQMVEAGMLEHAGDLLRRFAHGQIFLIEHVFEYIAELVQHRKAVEVSRCSSNNVPIAAASSSAPSVPSAESNAAPSSVNYLTDELIGIIVDTMRANVGNDVVMVCGNATLWGLGNVPEYRAAILLHPQSQEVLRLSIPFLITSGRA